MKLSKSHSMPFLKEDDNESSNSKNVYDVIASYITLIIKNLHCIDNSTNYSFEESSRNRCAPYLNCYNEISKCNLDPKSLRSCRRLIKAISIFNDKAASLQSQLINSNKCIKTMKKQTKNDQSLIQMPNSVNDEIKKFDVQMLILDTNQHAQLIDSYLENVKRYIKNKNKNNDKEKFKVIPNEQFDIKSIDMDSQEDNNSNSNSNGKGNGNHNNTNVSYLESELLRLRNENQTLKIELRFIYEQMQLNNKIHIVKNKNSLMNSNNKIGSINDNDYSFNSSDICFKVNDTYNDITWITLKNFIIKLKETEFDI